ncbi:MAG: RraA family protein [Planctomycetaceae bacterium]|jgi:regulator of RNase E activity RraA|nr:RraA family protein [Planctomycetaceae bacterium]
MSVQAPEPQSGKMHLLKLRQLRDDIEKVELSVSETEIIARYERLYTGCVNDVLREHCLTNQALPAAIHPLRDEMVLAGFAFTIRSNADPSLEGELELRVKMLDELRPNMVCVWNANGIDDASHWGGVMTKMSKKQGVRGAVIDGGIRDTGDILSQKFPIWYRYRISNGSLSRAKITGYQVPITVGTVLIKPGDLIFADIDGVIVIPRKLIIPVLERAETIESNEGEFKEWIDAGLSPEEVHNRGGYF